MKRKTIVAANWKMNGDLAFVDSITSRLNTLQLTENVDVILFPSYPYLPILNEKISNNNIAVGGQNISTHYKGAFTGEVSAYMLSNLGINYVIVGHSERRFIYGETTEEIAIKAKLACDSGLKPIICIGETEEERISGETEKSLTAQLLPVIDALGIEKFSDVVISYEPVWAIGTGKTASPELAQNTHQFIRSLLAQFDVDIAQAIHILYGGSVNSANCEKLFAQPDIDGGLIGGAGLNVDEFINICSTAKGT